VNLTQEKIDLIGKIIKNDRKYPNNEDLYEDFFNETCKRSVAILDAIESEVTLEAYLKRIVTTSILNVLKDSGRLRRTKTGYMSTKEVFIESDETVDYSNVVIDYASLNVPKNPEEIVIQKDILQFVNKTVAQIDKEDSEKKYLDIYTLRYDKGMTQKEISEQLGLSQSEVSKRLYKLMDKVKSTIE
jgi:RNA polymerase sigma factor (sigma-70 family)